MDSWSESSTGDNRVMRSSNYSDLPTCSPSDRITGYPEPWYQQDPSDDEPRQLYEMPTIRPCGSRSTSMSEFGDYAQTEVATHYFWIADYTSM